MSGGTLIALAADEIVMSEYAVLGPVDPQLGEYPAASILKAVAKKPVAETEDKTLISLTYPFNLDQTRLCLLLLRHRLALGFDRIDDKVTRFIRTAKADVQRTVLFIHNPTRHIFLLAPHIVIAGSVVASSEPPRENRRFSRSLYNPYSSV